MRKLIKPLIYGIPNTNAWDREELLNNIEVLYQQKRTQIICQTGIVIFGTLTLICAAISIIFK